MLGIIDAKHRGRILAITESFHPPVKDPLVGKYFLRLSKNGGIWRGFIRQRFDVREMQGYLIEHYFWDEESYFIQRVIRVIELSKDTWFFFDSSGEMLRALSVMNPDNVPEPKDKRQVDNVIVLSRKNSQAG